MKMSKERMQELNAMTMDDKRSVYVAAHAILQVEAKIMAQAGIDPDGNVAGIDSSLERMASAACDIAYLRPIFGGDTTIEAAVKDQANPWIAAFETEYTRAKEETNDGE